MATAPFDRDLLKSIKRSDDDIHRAAFDMKRAVVMSRKAIEGTRASMREADRLLKQQQQP